MPFKNPFRREPQELKEDIYINAKDDAGSDGFSPDGTATRAADTQGYNVSGATQDAVQSDAGSQGIYPDEHGRVAPAGPGQPGGGGEATTSPMDAEFTDEFRGGPPGPQRMDAEFTDEFRGGPPGPQQMDAEFTDELTGTGSGSTLLEGTPVGGQSMRTEMLNFSGDAQEGDDGQITADDDWESPVV